MNNTDTPYPASQSTLSQQESTTHGIAPINPHMKPQTYNNPREEHARRQQHRLISISEEQEETQNNSNNDWQVIRNTKRKKNTQNSTQHPREYIRKT